MNFIGLQRFLGDFPTGMAGAPINGRSFCGIQHVMALVAES